MKFKNKESIVIRGASTAWPEFTPEAEIVAVLRLTREATVSPRGLVPGEAAPADSADASATAHLDEPLMLLLSASHAAAPRLDSGQAAGNLETWLPLWRSTDSLSLLGESGVLQVGVNDLGWVVYDWIPGP